MKYCLVIAAILAIIFTLFPEIDIAVTQMAYDPVTNSFPSKKEGVLGFIFLGTYALVAIMGVSFSLLYIYQFFSRKEFQRLNRRFLVFFLLVYLMAPGIVVNGVVKANSGRARPGYVQEFNGQQQFTPPLMIADQCDNNCSFVSGHASSGFALMALAFAFPHRKKIFISLGVFAGLLVGGARILQGGHFLSDILFSGVITYWVIYGLHYIFYRRYPQLIDMIEQKVRTLLRMKTV